EHLGSAPEHVDERVPHVGVLPRRDAREGRDVAAVALDESLPSANSAWAPVSDDHAGRSSTASSSASTGPSCAWWLVAERGAKSNIDPILRPPRCERDSNSGALPWSHVRDLP